MRGNRGTALSQLFDNLAAGDTVTWAVVGVFLAVFAGIALFALKVHFDMKKEDAERATKYGRKKS